jgi:AcrR family transcriptional regulator
MTTPSSPDGLSRRERERRRRRQAMLRAAQSVFAEKGCAQATLDEIAERAEFGKGTLYNYFEGGKEDILFAVLDEVHDDIHEVIQEAFTGDAASDRSLRDCYHAMVLDAFKLFLEREDLFMVLLKETHRLCFSENAEHAAYFQRQQERMVDALAPVLERAIDEGTIQSLPPRAVAHMMLENINSMVVHRAMMDRNEECGETILHDPEQAADFLTTMLFDGMTVDVPAESHADHS